MKVSHCVLWVVHKICEIPYFLMFAALFFYFQAMVAMDLEGKIRRPRTEFDDERVRYEHRFAALGQVSTPPLVPYVQFKEMTKVRNYMKKYALERKNQKDNNLKLFLTDFFCFFFVFFSVFSV